MTRRGWVALGLAGAVAVVTWLGGREWAAPWAIPLVSGRIAGWTGWSVAITRLRVTPWHGFRAEEVFIQPPGGGRVHVRTLEARYHLDDLWQGRVASRWVARRIHLDPGSWKIRRPEAAARLSSGPVVDWMTLRLTATPRAATVETMRAQGWALRFHGAGRWRAPPYGAGQAGSPLQYWVRGQVAADLLQAVGLHDASGDWEPFVFRTEGTRQRPVVQFRSRFLTFSIGQPGATS